MKHVDFRHSLKFEHKDPFDRIIIAQSTAEKLILISKDESIKKYKVKMLWK